MDVLDLVNDNNRMGPGHDIAIRPFMCAFLDCRKAFARKSDLARHFRIHTNERPFQCLHADCGKSFIQRSALTVHVRTHTGERPHGCEACSKTFADSSSLARHRRIHTGKRPYDCKVPGCGRSFARRVTFSRHYKATHPGLPPPNAEASRPTVPMPLWTVKRLNQQSTLQPGPPDADGRPQYWIPTPTSSSTTISAPHAYAVSTPSEGTACSHEDGYEYQGNKEQSPEYQDQVDEDDSGDEEGEREGGDDEEYKPYASRSTGGRVGAGGRSSRRKVGLDRGRRGRLPPRNGGRARGGAGRAVRASEKVGGQISTNSRTDSHSHLHVHVSPAETEQEASIGTPLSSAYSELREIGSGSGFTNSTTQSIHTPEPPSATSIASTISTHGFGLEDHSDFHHSKHSQLQLQQQSFNSSFFPGLGGHQNPSHAQGYGSGLFTSAPLPVISEGGASHFSVGYPLDARGEQQQSNSASKSRVGSVGATGENGGLLTPIAFNNLSDHHGDRRSSLGPPSQSRQSSSLRAASNPEMSRPVINTSSLHGGLGGGFSEHVTFSAGGKSHRAVSDNITLLAGSRAQIPSYPPSQGDRSVSGPSSRDYSLPPQSQSRTRSTELTLDMHMVPDFSIQAPTGPAVHVSYSAVDGYYHNPVILAPSPFNNVPSHDGRLHSAPPHLQRFNSLPSVPTQSSFGQAHHWDISPVSAQSGTFTDMSSPLVDVHSIEAKWVNIDGESVHEQEQGEQLPESHQSQDQQQQRQSQTQGQSQAPSPMPPAFSPALPPPPQVDEPAPATPLWSQPIQYPAPPQSQAMARNPFPVPASSTPSLFMASSHNSSTLPYTPYMPQAPTHQQQQQQPQQQQVSYPLVQQRQQPYVMPQYSGAYQQPQHQPMYYSTPITPSNNWNGYRVHSQPVSALGSPVTFTGYHAATSHNSPVGPNPRSVSDDYRHDVLLTTPPRYQGYHLGHDQFSNHQHHFQAQSHSQHHQHQHYQHQHHDQVNTVGLGISNVHFDEGRYITPLNQNHNQNQIEVEMDAEMTREEEMVSAYIEGEPEQDLDLDSDLDYLVDDDSDDEFIPGGKNKRQSKKGKVGKKGRASMEVRRSISGTVGSGARS